MMTFPRLRFTLAAVSLPVLLGAALACSSDTNDNQGGPDATVEGKDAGSGGAPSSGGASGTGGAPGSGGASTGGASSGGAAGNASSGGASADAGPGDAASGGGDGASAEAGAGDAGSLDAGGPTGLCTLTFSNDTSNAATSPPLSTSCDSGANTTELSFSVIDAAGGVQRNLSVEWFEPLAAAGTTLQIASGGSAATQRGVHVQYTEFVGSTLSGWIPDGGSLTLTATSAKSFTITFDAAHFTAALGTATGSFQLDGTMIATLP